MISKNAFTVFALFAGGVAGPARSTELQRVTIDAWQAYLRRAEIRMQGHLNADKPFLWIDEVGDISLRLRRGEIVVAPLIGQGTQDVPGGVIHDWIGGVFIPNASIGSLRAVLNDYASYKHIYRPAVVDSKMLACNASVQEFSMVWQRHVLFVNAAIRGNYRANDFTVDSRRGYSIVDATSIQQIEDYARSSEHLLPPDTGSGFIWRIHSIARYEERDGGVYLEIEAIALTRDIPVSVSWLLNPAVHRLSMSSLTVTLRQTRQAVDMRPVTGDWIAMSDRKGHR
jgi:hypothetical protein